MGTLTKSELISEISAFFGDRSDIIDSRIIRWLNLAQMRIGRLRDWQELEVLSNAASGTTADDKFVVAPTNIRKIYSLRLIDGTHSRKLIRKPLRHFDTTIPYPERYATGRPEFYIYWGGRFELYKIPDAAYDLKLRYIKWPTDFATSTDVVSDLSQKDDAIIMLTVSWGMLSLRNNQDANYYWSIYRSMINEAAGEEVEGPDVDRTPDTNRPTTGAGEYYKNPFIDSMSQVE